MNEKALLETVPAGLFINGTWRAASDGATFEVEDPATGAPLRTVAAATPGDGRDALNAAAAAQHDWARTPLVSVPSSCAPRSS